MNKKIIQLYKQGLSAYQIMDRLKISSKFFVYNVLKKADIIRDYINCRHPNVNSGYFDKIDTHEKAYWLGFIFADGCVRDKRSGFTLAQHPKDIYVLQELAKVLNVKTKIGVNKQPLATLYVNNVQLKKALIHKGCVPRKSLILKPPLHLPKKFRMTFILGLFDGDGSIYIRKRPFLRFCFDICGAKSLINWCKEVLQLPGKVTKHRSIYRIETTNLDAINRLYFLLYKNSKFNLKRKQDIFKQACAVHNRKVMEYNRAKTEKVKRIAFEKKNGKVCKTCKIRRPINDFNKHYGQTYDGLQIYCHKCQNAYQRRAK